MSRNAMTLGVSCRTFPMIARWSSGRDAACNAVTARRASTSGGSTSGRKTLLVRLGPTVAVGLHATGPGPGGGAAGGAGGGGVRVGAGCARDGDGDGGCGGGAFAGGGARGGGGSPRGAGGRQPPGAPRPP